VIVSYRGKRTKAFVAHKRLKALSGVERPAWLALDRLAAAHTLADLKALQSHRLEPLVGDCRSPYAIRINEEWRICFEWPEISPGPTNVELVESASGDHMAPVAIHPGEHLAEELRASGLSASELARRIKVPTNRVTGILNGQRGITGDTALRLAHFFGTSAEFWVNLQSLHDLQVAEAKAGEIIERLPTLRRAASLANGRRSGSGMVRMRSNRQCRWANPVRVELDEDVALNRAEMPER
jgi:addiction module HigA family antidote